MQRETTRNSRSSWQRGGGDWEVGREESSNNLPAPQTLFPLQFCLSGEAASRKNPNQNKPLRNKEAVPMFVVTSETASSAPQNAEMKAGNTRCFLTRLLQRILCKISHSTACKILQIPWKVAQWGRTNWHKKLTHWAKLFQIKSLKQQKLCFINLLPIMSVMCTV